MAAACGGGSPAATSSAGPDRAQKVDAFALCVRDHGFYISRISVSSAADYNGPGLYFGDGWIYFHTRYPWFLRAAAGAEGLQCDP
jgi:hypothetical protein